MAGGPTLALCGVGYSDGQLQFQLLEWVTKDTLNVINLVDSICPHIGFHVSLIGIEIWNQANLSMLNKATP